MKRMIATGIFVLLAGSADARDWFNPAMSLDLGFANAKQGQYGGGNLGFAFSAFGRNARFGAVGFGVNLEQPDPRYVPLSGSRAELGGRTDFTVYFPLHLIVGGEDGTGGIGLHAAPLWIPSRHAWGLTFGISLVAARGDR